MDRSFLSNEAIIEASRKFVCIRTATYEDEKEAEFLRTVYSRGENLENTVFAMLSPDGTRKLIRADRGPMQFRRPTAMASKMDLLAKEFAVNEEAAQQAAPTPRMKDIRLGLNVAACDCLPLVIAFGETDEQAAELSQKLSSSAWSSELMGAFIYSKTSDAEELTNIAGLAGDSGFIIVEPDTYGLTGKVIDHLGAETTAEELKEAMLGVVSDFERPIKSHRNHVNAGKEDGKAWETQIPVEDPMALRAEARQREGGGNQRERRGPRERPGR